jgi:hypothetical protein
MKPMRNLGRLAGLLAVVTLCACATHQGDTMVGGDVGLQGAPGLTATPPSPTAAKAPSTGSADTGVTATTTGSTTETNGSSVKKVDCSAVRCAACPEGQHPALVPPDCCRCVPG